MPKFSVLIRTLNEERWLGECLNRVFSQTVKDDIEVLILDSGSTDRTLEIANRFPVKLSQISREEFGYSFALNRLAEMASGELLVCLSGHSVLCYLDAFEKADKHFQDESVAGVYGPQIALPDAGIAEKIFYLPGYFMPRLKEKRPHIGIMSNTNSMIRRELWQKHQFNESLNGSEDGEWARHWMKRKMFIILEPKMRIMHSHYLGVKGLYRQLKGWRESNNRADAIDSE